MAYLFPLLLLLTSCSGPKATPDAGSADTDVDSDTDVDGDDDSDTESDTGSATETDTGFVTDAGPWEWVENPEGEDCGPGCTQLTFANKIRTKEWDVWDKYLTYSDYVNRHMICVDIDSKQHIRIPDFHPEYPNGKGSSSVLSTAVHEQNVFYVLAIYNSQPLRQELVHVDLSRETQTLIWSRATPKDNPSGYYVPDNIDVYGDHLVSRGGAGDPMSRTFSTYPPPWPTGGQAVIDDNYGGFNTIWEGIVVFLDLRESPFEVTGYDLTKKEFIEITNDTEHQNHPRIQETRVVYMDYRLGEGNPYKSWERAAIFMYDIDTDERLQITDGKTIAAYPDVFGDIIVWQDHRHCDDPNNKNDFSNVEIYGYDLESRTEFRITNLPGRGKSHPRIWGDRVFVDMANDGGNGIYLFDLPEELKSP